MNQQIIHELYQQAMVTVPENPGNKEFTWFDPEKFAKLIAQHILDMLKVEREHYANPGMYNTEEYYIKTDAKVDVLDDAISMIRRDFGVV